MTWFGAFERRDSLGSVPAMAFVIGLTVAVAPAAAQNSVPTGPVLKAPDPTCLAWSDGCRTCRYDTKRLVGICSNVGIACQPREVTCMERQPDAEKK
jgi:hypothetical protein